MSVNHILWIRFRPDVPSDRIEAHLAALRGLASEVPGILDLSLGANFTERAQGYTHGLVVKLTDKAALDVYAKHPRHVEVATALRADSELLALDYEF